MPEQTSRHAAAPTDRWPGRRLVEAESWWERFLPEQSGWDRVGQRLISGRVQVQVVADIEGREDLPGVLRIAGGEVEVDHGVESMTRANPVVDCLPGRFAQSLRVVVTGVAAERRDRGAVDPNAHRVRSRDDLVVG